MRVILAEMGVIQGGWDYVAAAWGISLGIFAIYIVTVELRLRHHRRNGDKP